MPDRLPAIVDGFQQAKLQNFPRSVELNESLWKV